MDSQQTLSRREVLSLGVAAGLSSPFVSLLSSAWGKEVVLRASYLKISALMQYFTAKEQGFFKAEGIKLNDTVVRSGAMNMEGIISGTFELGISNTVDIAQINLKGIAVKILYPGTIISKDHPYTQLMVPPNSHIKAPKDLEGRRVGVPVVRSSIDLGLRNWMALNGADPAKVRFVELGFAGILPGLMSKQVDAVLAIEPAVTLIRARKIGKAIAFPHGALNSPILVVGYISRQSWIDKNPATAQAIVQALDKATKWLLDHPKEVPAVIGRNTRIKEGLARKIILPGLTRVARKSDLQPFIDMAAKFNYIPRSLDVCSLFSKYCPQVC